MADHYACKTRKLWIFGECITSSEVLHSLQAMRRTAYKTGEKLLKLFSRYDLQLNRLINYSI